MNLKNLRTKLTQSGRIVLEYLAALLSLVLSLVALLAQLVNSASGIHPRWSSSITSEQFGTMSKTPSVNFLLTLVSRMNRINGTLLRLVFSFPSTGSRQ
jgi:hypothetical protein